MCRSAGDLASARRFFTAARTVHGDPTGVVTDRAPALANVIEDLVPAGMHDTGQDENNRVECDHGRLKTRLKPMRGPKTERTASAVVPGARVGPEPASWPLRARCRHRPAVPAGHRIRRTHVRHLTSTGAFEAPGPAPACPATKLRNRASQASATPVFSVASTMARTTGFSRRSTDNVKMSGRL
jgi:hypothetical protein